VITTTQDARQAAWNVAWQLLTAAMIALAWLVKGGNWSLAALSGSMAVVSGNWLAAYIALGGGVGTAGTVLVRMLVGMGLKWAVVIGTLAGCLALGLPMLALLTGMVAALAAHVLVMLGNSRTGGLRQ